MKKVVYRSCRHAIRTGSACKLSVSIIRECVYIVHVAASLCTCLVLYQQLRQGVLSPLRWARPDLFHLYSWPHLFIGRVRVHYIGEDCTLLISQKVNITPNLQGEGGSPLDVTSLTSYGVPAESWWLRISVLLLHFPGLAWSGAPLRVWVIHRICLGGVLGLCSVFGLFLKHWL